LRNIICPTFKSHCCTDIVIFYCQGHFPSAALRTLLQLCPSVMFTSFLTDCSFFFSTFSLPCLASSLKNILRKLLQLFVTHCSIPLSRRRASPQKHPPLLSDEHRGCQKWTGPWHCRPSLTDLILRSSFFIGCPFAQPVQVGSFHHRPLTLPSQSRAEHVFGSLRPLAGTVPNGVVASLDQLNSGDGEALHPDPPIHWLSILAITMLAWSTYFSPSLFQMGVSCLQCLSAHGHHVEILADQNLHTSCVPVLGNLLGHLVLLQLSSKQLGNRVFDVLCLNLIVVRLELGHVLTQLDGPKGG